MNNVGERESCLVHRPAPSGYEETRFGGNVARDRSAAWGPCGIK